MTASSLGRAWAPLLAATLFSALAVSVADNGVYVADYGVDVSYPMHTHEVSKNYHWLPHNVDSSLEIPPEHAGRTVQRFGDRQTEYERLIKGCADHYGPKGFLCYENENDRIAMNMRQPQSMVNYTKLGFTKIKAPEAVFKLIQEFWQANRHRALEESWPKGNTYVNHWEGRSLMASVEDQTLVGGGEVLKQQIWGAARDTIQEWTGQRLAECSLYGVRIYEEGAVLATHVDRLPLVSSAIINVDQDVDEPWPLEVIGHDGKAHNVTMEPGDLVLYESHSVLHGRPFPLKGRFYANVFVHFEPIGKLGEESIPQGGLPPYVVPDSPQAPVWWRENPEGWKLLETHDFTTGTTEAHRVATKQDYGLLNKILEADPSLANAKDGNGWTPLHEAVIATSEAIVELLIESGADVNAVTNGGETALSLATEYKGEDHSLVTLLKSLGAKMGSEL
ncbi:Ankyrin Repeat [Seminavis robusta]|uniref:Ankyrin Repeat n=1 Tax=Seminavis robusta TaxID=568900 RepID=A0A9N8EBU5_9STRA|nr:Ankyrin Repeat [Seminavis robusta]|eukprot:Sro941_g222640.1 Ankyrin Repeat (449) ;mRNA; f:21875-23992